MRNLHFAHMPLSSRESLFETIALRCRSNQTNDREIALILVALADLQVNWDDLDLKVCEGIRDGIVKTISEINSQVEFHERTFSVV
jgi:hypothetical protein